MVLLSIAGLMGKALLEKLLRSCTQLNRIFVLLRDRKGMSAYDRLKKLKENRVSFLVDAQRNAMFLPHPSVIAH